MQLGPQTIGTMPGVGYTVLANKVAFSYKPIGVTIDWSHAHIPVVKGRNTILTLTIDATGGTFTLSYGAQTTAAIAENATAATVEEALEGLSTIGNGNVRVSGNAGGPYTIEFVENLRHTATTPLTADASSLTGGAGTATVATVQAGAPDAPLSLPGGYTVPVGEKYIPAGTVIHKLGSGKYAPATDATTLVRGECFVTETHLLYSEHLDQVGTVFDNGNVLQAALQVGGTGQPSLANFRTAFPAIRLFTD